MYVEKLDLSISSSYLLINILFYISLGNCYTDNIVYYSVVISIL
jgi:hypothetical protein